MSAILRLANQRRETFFDRREFDNLLSVYSLGVANGHWRDYALDQGRDEAAFFIYRYANEQPTYIVIKKKSGKFYRYILIFGGKKVAQSTDISEIILTINHN